MSRHYFLALKTHHFLNIDKNKQFKLIFYCCRHFIHGIILYGHTSIRCVLSLTLPPNPILNSFSFLHSFVHPSPLFSRQYFFYFRVSSTYRIYVSIKKTNKPRAHKWKGNVCFSKSGLIQLIWLWPVLSILLKHNMASFLEAKNFYNNYTGLLSSCFNCPMSPEYPQTCPSEWSSWIAGIQSAQIYCSLLLLNFRNCFRKFKFAMCLIFTIVTNSK